MMVTTKRSDDLARGSPSNNKRARNAGGGITESLISGDLLGGSNQDIFNKLSDELASKLSKSVVSIVLSNGHKVLFECSGIAMDRKSWTTRFLTSASLVRALNGTKQSHGSLKIEVHLGGGEVHEGFLARFYSDEDFAVVYVMTSLDVHVLLLEDVEEILPHGDVIAAGRDRSGKLIVKIVIPTGDLSRSDDKELMLSEYKPEAWEGGPLFDCVGDFVGMNVFLLMEQSFFLPRSLVIKGMKRFRESQPMLKKRCKPLKPLREARSKERPTGDISICYLEENFGEEYGKGVWMEFSKRASSNINRCVVALASYNENSMLFTCSGFFIEWNGSTPILTPASLVRSSHDENKIYENMRIVVLLPNNKRIEGTLQHCNLHYNIDVVSVENYRARWPANVEPSIFDGYSIVASVGRCFKSCTLMAANGLLTDRSGTLDCKFLAYSSCKISKRCFWRRQQFLDGYTW